MGTSAPMVRGHPLKLPFLLGQAGHSQLLVLVAVSASRKDTGPGREAVEMPAMMQVAPSLGRRRQTWQVWRRCKPLKRH